MNANLITADTMLQAENFNSKNYNGFMYINNVKTAYDCMNVEQIIEDAVYRFINTNTTYNNFAPKFSEYSDGNYVRNYIIRDENYVRTINIAKLREIIQSIEMPENFDCFRRDESRGIGMWTKLYATLISKEVKKVGFDKFEIIEKI